MGEQWDGDDNRNTHVPWWFAVVLSLAAFVAGQVNADRGPRGQDANELIQTGFTIVDPEGYEVGWFGDQ